MHVALSTRCSVTLRLESSCGSPVSKLPRKIYELQYPDGSRKHIGRADRDELLLSGCAKQVAQNRYLFTGQSHTLHALSELSILNIAGESQNPRRRFLPGCFIVDLKGKRLGERLETSDCCALELSLGRYQSRAIGEFHAADSGAREATN